MCEDESSGLDHVEHSYANITYFMNSYFSNFSVIASEQWLRF